VRASQWGGGTPFDKHVSRSNRRRGRREWCSRTTAKRSHPPTLALGPSNPHTLALGLSNPLTLALCLSNPLTRSLPGSLSPVFLLSRSPSLSDSTPSSFGHCISLKRKTLDSPLSGCGVSESTLETTLGQMPPESGGILRGCTLLGGAICPNVVSRVVC